MSRRNQANDGEDIARTIVGAAAGVAVAFGAYKMFGSLFGSAGPSQNEPHTGSRHNLTFKPFPIKSIHQFPKNSKIAVVETEAECRDAIELLQSHCNEFPVLGIDCEWVSGSGGRQKIALLQLASYSGLCVLIRLSELKAVPPALWEILEDDDILKVGVGVTRDAQYLLKDYRSSVLGTLELGYMACAAKSEGTGKSLDFFAEKYLRHSLEKGYNIRCGDWEAYSLSDEQIEYAALDALVAIEVFKVLAEKIEPNSTVNSNRLQRVVVTCSQYFGKSDR